MDVGRCLETQQAALNPDVAPFVQESYVVTRDWVGSSMTEGIEINSNSSFVPFEKHHIAGTKESVDSEVPRIAPISAQSNNIYMSGYIESKTVQIFLDKGAEVTAIWARILATLPKSLRTAFQVWSSTLKVANEDSLVANGLVLCNIFELGRTVLEAVHVMPTTDEVIMGMPVLTALGLYITWAEMEVLKSGSNPTVR